METDQVVFDEIELKEVIFSAALMSSIDKDVHDKEWEVIDSFASEHWKKDYGNFIEFQKRIFSEINHLLQDEASLYEKIDLMISEFSHRFSQQQKSIILDLLGYVMVADNIVAIEESNLFTAFFERLSIENSPISHI